MDSISAATVELGGELQIRPESGYVPTLLKSLKIIETTSGVSSLFDHIISPSVDPLVGFAVAHDAFSVFIAPAILGDANLDSFVDVRD